MQMTTVGIDMSKNVFQLRGVDAQGNVRLTQRVSRWVRNSKALLLWRVRVLQRLPPVTTARSIRPHDIITVGCSCDTLEFR
jgi:hypothetical protein